MIKTVAIISLLVFLSTGCASYTPQMVITPPDQYGVVCVKETGLCVKSDPYFSINRQKEVLGENFSQYDFFPIYVVVENNSSVEYEITENGVQLLGVEGVVGVGTGDIMAKAEKSGFGRALGISLIVPIIAIPIAAAATADSCAKTNKAMKEYLEANSFKPGIMKPNCSTKGFLFFNIKDVKDISGIGLRVTAINNKTKEAETVDIYFKEQLERDKIINLSCKSDVPVCLLPPKEGRSGTTVGQKESDKERRKMYKGKRR